jgi:hypothetical protein
MPVRILWLALFYFSCEIVPSILGQALYGFLCIGLRFGLTEPGKKKLGLGCATQNQPCHKGNCNVPLCLNETGEKTMSIPKAGAPTAERPQLRPPQKMDPNLLAQSGTKPKGPQAAETQPEFGSQQGGDKQNGQVTLSKKEFTKLVSAATKNGGIPGGGELFTG